MSSRTQIVCLHEGKKERSVDAVFINRLLKTIRPPWIRPWLGNKIVRPIDCGGRDALIRQMPEQLKVCVARGSDTTLMVWADMDDDMPDGEKLKEKFWIEAKAQGVTREQFDSVVFAFAKDRIENWIEFLNTGETDESKEGQRVKHDREAADAARKLAKWCEGDEKAPKLPPSLEWSCRNWRALVDRMKR